MSEDRFDETVRAVLLERAPKHTPPELRARVAAVAHEMPFGSRRRQSRLLAVAAGIATLAVIGATLVGLMALHSATVGPMPNPIPTPPAIVPNAGGVSAAGLIDQRHGWALVDQHLLMSDDGGATWHDITPSSTALLFLGNPKGVAFFDANHGWVAAAETFGYETDPSYGRVDVWRTDDGGWTWTKVQLPPAAVNTSGSTIPQVQFDFLDATHGFALLSGSSAQGADDSDLYWTADGGRTWSADRPTGTGRSGITGRFAFANADDGVIVGGTEPGGAAMTRDGGRTWHDVTLPLPSGCSGNQMLAQQPWLFADGSGVLPMLCLGNGRGVQLVVLTTRDAGGSWTTTQTIDGAGVLSVLGPQQWIMLDQGEVRRTNDGGRTWTSMASVVPWTFAVSSSFGFVDATTGWGLGGDAAAASAGRQALYATRDGGATWQALDPAAALAVVSPAPSATPSSSPATSATWPFRVADGSTPVRAPDGTLYVSTNPGTAQGQGRVYALDAAGRVELGWPFAPAGIIAFSPPVIGSDGTVFVAGTRYGATSGATIYALDPTGAPKAGWSPAVEAAGGGLTASGNLVVAPNGHLVVITSSLPPAGSGQVQRLVALDAHGSVVPGWPVTLPGLLTCGTASCQVPSLAFGADGSLYAEVGPELGSSTTFEIVAYGPDGTMRPGWPVRVPGEGFALGPGGTLYAWGVEDNGVKVPSTTPLRIVRTDYVALDPSGHPRPGWPVAIEGPASPPAIGADGTLYVMAGGDTGQPQRLVSISPAGRVQQLYTLPADEGAWTYGFGEGNPGRLAPPTVGPDGTLYIQLHKGATWQTQGLLAVAPDGSVRPGWPVWLSAGASFEGLAPFTTGGGGNVQPPVVATDGTAYVAIRQSTGGQGAVLALGPDGAGRPSWPFVESGSARTVITNIQVASDGAILVTGQAPFNGRTTVIFGLRSDGTPMH